ncbi:putative basic amino acid transporter [Dioszegia hungarica]|uniref:Protein BTN n=1 Tax=Dioszegia hungarica TaxID=4972 RepID=A0AA38HD93_9TREE|nr:putative basic amino acid transporter [Dioszegia hungarica]KAI9636806.1 putative basic amino acid transporter [Dioszegia hungarica]
MATPKEPVGIAMTKFHQAQGSSGRSVGHARTPSSDMRDAGHAGSEGDEDEEDVDAFIAAHDSSQDATGGRYLRPRLFASFLIFGLLNNVLYVIILSAALDLVGADTPKGVVAFFNIFPALLAKVGWPLISNGKIRYGRRVAFCTTVSWLGIVTIAFSQTVPPRLFGIALASLSSGLGELSFLQMTTTYPSRAASQTALGAWSTGTGAAGIAGAGLWWLLRGLGVKGGLGISSFLPLFFPFTYIFLLPAQKHFHESTNAYQPLATDSTAQEVYREDPAANRDPDEDGLYPKTQSAPLRLMTTEKLALIRSLFVPFMLPLGLVYTAEYMINSGVAPTLVFPVPTAGIWSTVFKSPRDYYPFWSLTYQTFVFISRASLSLGLPPLPLRLLPLPTIIQTLNLFLLSLQASRFILSSAPPSPSTPTSISAESSGESGTITRVFLLICLEGLCGGAAYVNAFYHVGRMGQDEAAEGGEGEEKRKMEREFRIGATGGADSCGILFASLLSMPLETSLCAAQIERGRTLCRDL